MDNSTQNEHQNSLPIPSNENESELQNGPPVSSIHPYIQPSTVPEISNPSGLQKHLNCPNHSTIKTKILSILANQT